MFAWYMPLPRPATLFASWVCQVLGMMLVMATVPNKEVRRKVQVCPCAGAKACSDFDPTLALQMSPKVLCICFRPQGGSYLYTWSPRLAALTSSRTKIWWYPSMLHAARLLRKHVTRPRLRKQALRACLFKPLGCSVDMVNPT